MSVLDDFPSACMDYEKQVKKLVLPPDHDMLQAGLKLRRLIVNEQVKPKILTKNEVTEFIAEVFTDAPLYALYYGQHSGQFRHSKGWRSYKRFNRHGFTVTEYSREGSSRSGWRWSWKGESEKDVRFLFVAKKKKKSSKTDESNDHIEVVSVHKTPVSLDDNGIAPLDGRSTLTDEETPFLDVEDTFPPANNNEPPNKATQDFRTTRPRTPYPKVYSPHRRSRVRPVTPPPGSSPDPGSRTGGGGQHHTYFDFRDSRVDFRYGGSDQYHFNNLYQK
ncbi:hypothetical protein F5050DRAFT_238762 [Lentinula boryana]|uniref:NAC domain-containing protein n=1 Tax=Lentinula boryana TaxID=40481 RepID=A0ABQ8QQX2_9AGAR|nr:hypothetical protein F5050DRAFT_238762 [Lentinula boryana]